MEIRFNSREIIIPWFQVGVSEPYEGWLIDVWEQFKDWRSSPVVKMGDNDG